MNINYYEMDDKHLIETLNQGKEVLLDALKEEKIITDEQYTMITNHYALTVHRKGTLGEYIDKFFNWFNNKDTVSIISVIKVLS